jgi:hypothetical protein
MRRVFVLLVFLFFFGHSPANSSEITVEKKESTLADWLTLALIDQLVIQEYFTLLPDSSNEATYPWTGTRDEVNVFKRAFIMQNLPERNMFNAQASEELKSSLLKSGKTLQTTPLGEEVKEFVRKVRQLGSLELVESIRQTYSDPKHQEYLDLLIKDFPSKPTFCAASDQLKHDLKTLLNQDRHRNSISSEAILLLRRGNQRDRICILAEGLGEDKDPLAYGDLSSVSMAESFDRLKLTPDYQDELSLLLTILYLKQEEYSEALRHLYQLTEKNLGFRLPYETVQRIFSLRQRGSGKVSIQGI